MVYQKFIIEGDNLILAKCTYHKQLAKDVTNVKGGGLFRKKDDNTFLLFGESYDFGSVNIDDLKKCIENGNVYSNSRLTKKLDGYKFIYDNHCELINLN